jgi:NAD(P)-dependent dehydrogenase (short-subunit alcohol dehydrogenase family)
VNGRRRVALITGASRGIGRATAMALSQAGFDVAVTARTQHEGQGVDEQGTRIPGSLDSTAEAVESAGGRCLPLPMDLMDHDGLTATVATVAEKWGGIDVLVNNAVHTGAGSMERWSDLTVAMVETKLAANVVAPFILTGAVVPGMLEQGAGLIVNVTSHVATNDPPAPSGEGGWGLGYAMSKAAFHRMAGHLAVEFGPRGVVAVNVDPGYVLTERMRIRQDALGLAGHYRGAPPTVPAAAIAWLATREPADLSPLNGTTVIAQRLALDHQLHPDWRTA